MSVQDQNKHVCTDCGADSPDVRTDYTLISPQHGWKVTRRMADGKFVGFEWRCPECWEAFRVAQEASR